MKNHLFQPINPNPTAPAPTRGLGDMVAKVAQPIAAIVDAVAGTNLKNCGGCKQRREKLNQKFPMKTIISAFLLAAALTVNAQTNWAYSTNMFSGLTELTNVYIRADTNEAYSDTYQIWINKLNANYRVLNGWHATERADAAMAQTNSIFTNALSAPFLLLTRYEVPNCTNLPPTNMVIGTIASGSNFLFKVVGTNANATNWWRIAWDTNGW